MEDHEEDIDDGSFTCRKCPYQAISWDDLEKHVTITHEIFKCSQCDIFVKTKREITTHMKENHYSYKPCDYFLENRCELDGECRYNHIKLKPGEQICYKCGKTFKLKSDMRKHITETHGSDICHKFLLNNCTARKCFFSHKTHIEAQMTERDFPSLPTPRPVVGIQVEGQVNQATAKTQPSMSKSSENLEYKQDLKAQVMEALTQIMPQLTQHLASALRTEMNPQ